jgi:hypothetical protein
LTSKSGLSMMTTLTLGFFVRPFSMSSFSYSSMPTRELAEKDGVFMNVIRFPLFWLFLLHAVSTPSYAKDDATRGDEANLQMAQESSEAAGKSGDVPKQGQQNPANYEGQNPQNPRGNQDDSQGTQGQQDQQVQDPRYPQGQQNPQYNQDPYNPAQPQTNPNMPQGQGANTAPNIQGQRGQGTPAQPGAGQVQDQLPPEAPQVKLPKKPRVFPSPTPTPTPAPTVTPAPTFTPAPAPDPLPEPATRPLPSGLKTDAQRSYESAMQTRWKTAADEIALLRSRGENLQGKKGKAFHESLRTASGNRSMARTKFNQLIRGSSADFDKLKAGVERAFADLDSSIARVRSYFDEPPPP